MVFLSVERKGEGKRGKKGRGKGEEGCLRELMVFGG